MESSNSEKEDQVNVRKNPKPHPIWESFPYMQGVSWAKCGINKNKKQACRRTYIHGVEIRLLGEGHILSGQYGLFASKKFNQFEIIGEYVGNIVDDNVSGEYVAALELKDWSLGVDAGKAGNEIRFINCYMGIKEGPNVMMQRVYIDTYPHIVIVCIKNIEIGEEILLDYGKSYIDEFLTKKDPAALIKKPEGPFNLSMFVDELPGYGDDKDSDTEGEGEQVATSSSLSAASDLSDEGSASEAS
jgi:hypothetical protein